jgi:hypothetical protein
LRPAAVCCTRAACTEAPVIILRAPKVTAEVDAAGATAARAVTRMRRMATGAFATKGAEMVIAAIVSVRKAEPKVDGIWLIGRFSARRVAKKNPRKRHHPSAKREDLRVRRQIRTRQLVSPMGLQFGLFASRVYRMSDKDENQRKPRTVV